MLQSGSISLRLHCASVGLVISGLGCGCREVVSEATALFVPSLSLSVASFSSSRTGFRKSLFVSRFVCGFVCVCAWGSFRRKRAKQPATGKIANDQCRTGSKRTKSRIDRLEDKNKLKRCCLVMVRVTCPSDSYCYKYIYPSIHLQSLY